MSDSVPSPAPKLPAPPKLTTIYSMSCGMPAETFFALLKDAGITAVADIRVGRLYSRAFWTSERDIAYICRLHNVEYVVLEDLMPTVELREALHAVIDKKPSNRAQCAEAWTRYLEQFLQLLNGRKILKPEGPVHQLVYGNHTAVAMICGCQHHNDCHRSIATTKIARWVEGVTVQELYRDGKPPARETEKVLLRDVHGIAKDDAARIARATKVRA